MPKIFEELVNTIQSLPGVGPKAAFRLAMYLLENKEFSQILTSNISTTLSNIGKCTLCNNISVNNALCSICTDQNRDRTKIALISNVSDLFAIEKSNAYKGLYFVFNNNFNIEISEEHIKGNLERLEQFIQHFKELGALAHEIILAFPYDIDSEVLCNIVSEYFKSNYADINISRISLGMPSGAYFEYTDKITIMKSFKGRTTL
jgi:recombination protein RecR